MLKGMKEERGYATRFWNNGDQYAGITAFNPNIDESYETFQRMSSKYENTEWIERIDHCVSSRGVEACDCEEKQLYNKHE